MDGIARCDFESANFLLFSESVPPLVYFSHFPIIVISILVGIFVFLQSPKKLANQLFFALILFFSSWVFLDSIFWASNRSDIIMFAWSAIILIEPLIYAIGLYLVYVLITKKDPPLLSKLIVVFLLFPLFFLAPTSFNLSGFDISTCLAIEGPIALYYTYFLEAVFLLWLLVCSVRAYCNEVDRKHKREIALLATGISLFFITFTIGNLFGSFTERWEIAHFGLFGMPIFLAFISYMIVRFQTFNIRVISTQALVVTLWLLLASLLAIDSIEYARIVIAVTLLIFTVLGYQLIRSVRREVEQRTAIEKLARDLEAANTRLKELDKLKTEFVSIASHQLRSPLAAVKGYASMLLEGSFGELSVGAKEAIGRIFSSSAFMARSVDDFLNVSRIELGRMKYDLSTFDVCSLIDLVIDEQKPFANKKKITLKHEKTKDTSGCQIYADIGKVKQVLTNLVDNAIKYTPKGSVTLAFERNLEKKTVTIMVKDTGMGISKTTLERLFRKFSRADNANEVNVTGTGLGLYVAKNLIEAQNGRIWAESEGEGKGSTFCVELPEAAVQKDLKKA